ncbi:MAG: hypothetical protein ABIR59_13305 [Gemmatimonadales bacterium]
MTPPRRIRGLLGTAITWGGIGSLVGLVAFVVIMRPWLLRALRWDLTSRQLGEWEAASVLWGSACGVAFGVAIIALERTRRLHQLTLHRVTAWGALAGALVPTLLSIRPIMAGAGLSYFGAIIGASALAGALWARFALVIARRTLGEPSTRLLDRSAAELPIGAAKVGSTQGQQDLG